MKEKQKVRFLVKASVAELTLENPETLTEAEDKQYVDAQPDLIKIDAILVSTGVNDNDDAFLASELLPARNTAKHKPLNIEHQDAHIIGHMTNSYVITKEGRRIPETEILENPLAVPKNFDIASESVMYAEIFPDEARKIRELAQAGELFVSVEAWYTDYDYIVGNRIVERNAATAEHLEQFLRFNGGDGLMEGQRVGRVLRDLTIAGIGLVKTPANKDSVIRSVSADRAGLGVDSDVCLKKLIEENTKALLEDDCPIQEGEMAGESKNKTQAGASKEKDNLEQKAEEQTKEEAETETTGEAQKGADESKQDVDATKEEGKAEKGEKSEESDKDSSNAETQEDSESNEAEAEAVDNEAQQKKVDDRFAKLETMINGLKETVEKRDSEIGDLKSNITSLTEALEEARGDTAEDNEGSSEEEETEEDSTTTTDEAEEEEESAADSAGEDESTTEEDAGAEEQPTSETENGADDSAEETDDTQTDDAASDDDHEEDLINLGEEAIEEIFQDALNQAEKEEETVQFKSDDDGEDDLYNQFTEVFHEMDIGLILEDKKEE